MSALLFIELDRTVLFLSSPLAPHEDVAKVLHVVRLEANKLLVFVDAVVGLELLVTTLADKHMATVLPKYVLVSRLQRLESIVTYITGVNPLSLFCALSPHSDPIQQQHDFPHKPALDIFRSRCNPLHVLLKVDPSLEGDVADDKADPSVCHQLGQVTVLQYFQGTAGSMNHQHVLRLV